MAAKKGLPSHRKTVPPFVQKEDNYFPEKIRFVHGDAIAIFDGEIHTSGKDRMGNYKYVSCSERCGKLGTVVPLSVENIQKGVDFLNIKIVPMFEDPMYLFKYASRSRPDNFFRGLDSITENMQSQNYRVLVTLDADDKTMIGSGIKDRLSKYPHVTAIWGFSKNKIDAINRDMEFSGAWDILINFSDDQLFLVNSFDEYIKEDANKFFPKGDLFLHYPDTHAKDRQATMSIMDRKYYDRFGYIYNPEYASVYCDNEALDVAKLLGRHKFVNRNIFDHYHPAWGTAPNDDQYRKSEHKSTYERDANTYALRKALNFKLK